MPSVWLSEWLSFTASDLMRTFAVQNQTQTISFPRPANRTWSQSPFVVSATASRGCSPCVRAHEHAPPVPVAMGKSPLGATKKLPPSTDLTDLADPPRKRSGGVKASPVFLGSRDASLAKLL